MNTIFSELESKINLLFTNDPWMMYRLVPYDVRGQLVENEIDSNARWYMFNIRDFIDVHIVMSGDESCYINKFVMLDNKLAIICVVPSDLLSISTPILIKIIFNLYRFIINFIDTEMFRCRLPYLFDYAPEILAMDTLLSFFKLEYDELTFIDKEKAILFNKYDVATLLDSGLVTTLNAIRSDDNAKSDDKNS